MCACVWPTVKTVPPSPESLAAPVLLVCCRFVAGPWQAIVLPAMSSMDWSARYNAIETVRRLVTFHPDTVIPHLCVPALAPLPLPAPLPALVAV